MMYSAQYVICGAGIIGLTIARELVASGADSVIIFDKEEAVGKHASGRNSGILHAGIYYDPGTLKAQMCLEGNKLMQAYCESKGLPLFKSGKVIVTRTEEELETLKELQRRATANGGVVEMIGQKRLAEIEPNAKTVEQALYSPLTAVVDPKAVLKSLQSELEATNKVRFLFNTRFEQAHEDKVSTNQGFIGYDVFINAAGAYSDIIAKAYGVGKDYRLLPFKGIYRVLKKPAAKKIRGSIYPVPNIRNPFLGVHFTRNVHGDVYVGPTAIPAFGRENYGLIKGIDKELFSILFRDLEMLLENEKFRNIAMDEPRKYLFKYFFDDARKLVKYLAPHDLLPSTKVGIRPQLVNTKTKELVMDFVVEQRANTIHILNSISPAFTSSMSFARMVVNEHVPV